ncbi:hypothetical protein ACWC9S_09715 [Streptomyces xiamenensis]
MRQDHRPKTGSRGSPGPGGIAVLRADNLPLPELLYPERADTIAG